jgi:hypothetical protein
MRLAPWLLVFALGACASSTEGITPFAKAQTVVDTVAARHADLVRLTLHAVPSGRAECTQLASTIPERAGRPSDPEDLTALETGTLVVLEEPDALDVTVPILMVDGKPSAVAGVTLRVAADSDRAVLVGRAKAIAEELASAARAAGMPPW